MLGIFGDYYFDDTKGFHLQAMMGAASAQVQDNTSTSSDNATMNGLGLAFGLGYDFWVGEQWSIGPEARVMWASLKNSKSDIDEKYTVWAPTLLFSVTYH